MLRVGPEYDSVRTSPVEAYLGRSRWVGLARPATARTAIMPGSALTQDKQANASGATLAGRRTPSTRRITPGHGTGLLPSLLVESKGMCTALRDSKFRASG